MLIKTADDKSEAIALCEQLALSADPATRKHIETDLRNLRAGIKGESESAYLIDFHFAENNNWIARSGQPGINSTEYGSLTIPLPPTLHEQQRIADCLTSLDDLITDETQKLEAIKTHKKGLMQQLFPSVGGVDSEAGRGGNDTEATTPRLRRTPPKEGN